MHSGTAMGLSESRSLGPGQGSSERQVEEEEEAVAAAAEPLLHMVARKGHCEMACQLLAQDSEAVNSQDNGGRTPLFWATEYRHERLVELLLAHGADPAVQDHEGNLCLHWAAYVGSAPIARMLLDAGSDVDALNGQGDSPLHLAAQERRYECLVLLLAHGAKASLQNRAGQGALQCAPFNSPSRRALEAASALPRPPTERLLCRDISRGFEPVPIPCVNGVDEEPAPSAFLYITQTFASDSAALAARGWGRSQRCECAGSCSVATCPCVERSLRAWYTPDGRLLPDAASSPAQAGPIVECHMLCACASSCPNRVAQRGLRTQLQLYRTPGKGWAVRTLQDVPRGAFLCQYFGELISSAEAAQREDAAYSFVVDTQGGAECCLDGRFYGSVGRFLNHSCQPNLVALPVVVGHEIPGIAFFSSRTIQAGEELVFDYGERFWEAKGRRWACLCKSPGCRYPPSREGPPTAAAAAVASASAAGDPGLGPSTSHPLRGFSRKSARSSQLKTTPRRSARPRRRPRR